MFKQSLRKVSMFILHWFYVGSHKILLILYLEATIKLSNSFHKELGRKNLPLDIILYYSFHNREVGNRNTNQLL